MLHSRHYAVSRHLCLTDSCTLPVALFLKQLSTRKLKHTGFNQPQVCLTNLHCLQNGTNAHLLVQWQLPWEPTSRHLIPWTFLALSKCGANSCWGPDMSQPCPNALQHIVLILSLSLQLRGYNLIPFHYDKQVVLLSTILSNFL